MAAPVPLTSDVFVVVVEAPEGHGIGRVCILRPGSMRVIGRTRDDLTLTAVVTRAEQRRLEDDDHQRAFDHITRRRAVHQSARAAVDAFDRDDDFDVGDDAVSQTHAIIFFDEAGLSIVDVQSKNGTWVNGERVDECVLGIGDLIRVGGTRLELQKGS